MDKIYYLTILDYMIGSVVIYETERMPDEDLVRKLGYNLSNVSWMSSESRPDITEFSKADTDEFLKDHE